MTGPKGQSHIAESAGASPSSRLEAAPPTPESGHVSLWMNHGKRGYSVKVSVNGNEREDYLDALALALELEQRIER